MSAYYDLYQTPDPLGENRNEPRLHARILPRGTISADKFRELVAKATGFSPAILDGTLQVLRTNYTVGCPRVGRWKWASWAISPYR